jgi:hypothetical protein
VPGDRSGIGRLEELEFMLVGNILKLSFVYFINGSRGSRHGSLTMRALGLPFTNHDEGAYCETRWGILDQLSLKRDFGLHCPGKA